tara:strand:- start:2666 stop:3391 length:726 start_codon:yes stop_codon:yes gene_type:complete
MIVCIPTKERPQTKTYKLFEEAGITPYHFIEPQDYDSYDVPNKICIGKDNHGITYVRNFMLTWCKKNKHSWSWFCDDDITQFGKYDGKTKKTDAYELHKVYDKAKRLPFEIVGIGTRAFAWTSKKSVSINSKFVEGCVLMNTEKINWKYREDTKEDRDFCLQCIQNGHGILRFNTIFFDTPVIGTNDGGLHEWYQTKKDHDASKKLVLTWSPWIKLKQKHNRLDIKADIAGFAKSCMRKVI